MRIPDQQMVTVGKASMDSLLARIILAGSPFDKVPARFKTVKQWSVAWGKGPKRTGELVAIAVRLGIMEKRIFRVASSARGCFPVPHYAERKSASS